MIKPNSPRLQGTFALVRPMAAHATLGGTTPLIRFTNIGSVYGYYPIPLTQGNAQPHKIGGYYGPQPLQPQANHDYPYR